MMPRIEATIDLQALTHNFSVVRDLVPKQTQIMPMVKANAYGHGLIEVAHQLNEADAFGVATLPEAFKLRDSGIEQPIFVMCGFRSPDELSFFSEFDLTAVIHHPDQITYLSESRVEKPISAWLKVDTGMHRLGVSPDDFSRCFDAMIASDQVLDSVGVMTHLAAADSDADYTAKQITCFEALTEDLNCLKSVANSAAILEFPSLHYDLVRPGIMLYGISPFVGKTGQDFGLKPVMTLVSYLVSYKKVSQGESIGYGCVDQADRDLILGVVTAGYGDGYPRHAHHGSIALVDDYPCPILGRISMDLLAIDISAVPHPSIGKPVLLWGEDLPAERVAAASDTIAYELLCQLTDRVVKKTI